MDLVGSGLRLLHNPSETIIPKPFLLLRWVVLIFDDESQIPEHSGSNDSDFEFHAVGGQSASLIRKDMLNLPQFFIKWWASSNCPRLSKLAVHEPVLIDKGTLRHLDNLYRDDKRDGDHGIDEHDVWEEGKNSIYGCGVTER